MENLRIVWKHTTYSPKEGVERPRTICCILNSNNETIYNGVADCYFKDLPNRKIALKQSFRKAVLSIPDRRLRSIL